MAIPTSPSALSAKTVDVFVHHSEAPPGHSYTDGGEGGTNLRRNDGEDNETLDLGHSDCCQVVSSLYTELLDGSVRSCETTM